MKVPDLFVGKRLFVGCDNPPVTAFGIGPTEVRGSAYLEGPVMVGTPISYSISEAALMVARCVNEEALPPPPSIFKVSTRGVAPTPIDVMLGDPTGHVGIAVNSTVISIFNDTTVSINSPYTTGVGNLNWVGSINLIGAETLTGAQAQTGAEARSSQKVFNGIVTVNGLIKSDICKSELGIFASVAAPFKQFDIPHPSKSGMRLRHACIEGPEVGVYYRGKLKNSNIIQLPDYWRELVDAETITVNLTPHGCYQELYVKAIEWGTRITILNNSGGPIDCSYTVYGKRKDVPDLVVEYVGSKIEGEK
jgi:hypothetical protein